MEAIFRVAVVSEVRLYREGLSTSLQSKPQFTVEGIAPEPDTGTTLDEFDPHVVVLDSTCDSCLELLRTDFTARKYRVVIFPVIPTDPRLVLYAQAGVAAYVPREASLDEITRIIDRVARGEVVCDPEVMAHLLRRLAKPSTDSVAEQAPILTRREDQVLTSLQEGLSNKEIAQRFHIAEATVKNHVHHLLEKLNVSSRGQAAARAVALKRPRRALGPDSVPIVQAHGS